VAKIADFGLSAECRVSSLSSFDILNERMGTILYMAPEQALGQRYGKRIDIWAAGIILYILCTGKHPFYTLEDDQ
jgi:serine/threonine protein kinase